MVAAYVPARARAQAVLLNIAASHSDCDTESPTWTTSR